MACFPFFRHHWGVGIAVWCSPAWLQRFLSPCGCATPVGHVRACYPCPGHFCGCCESCGTAELVHTPLLQRPHPCQSVITSTHAHQPRACRLLWCQASLPASGARSPILGLPPATHASGQRLPHFAMGGSSLRCTQSFSQPSQEGCTLRKARAHRSARRRTGPWAGAEARGADTWIPAKQDPWCRHGPLRAPTPACVTPGEVSKAPGTGVEETYEVPVPPPGSG